MLIACFFLKPECNLNKDALKFLKEIDIIRCKVGVFDARIHNIVGWFKRFEFYSDLFGWGGEQRVDALPHLLTSEGRNC